MPRRPLEVLPHGTVSGYNYHRCRCPECREVWRLHVKALRDRRTPQQRDSDNARQRAYNARRKEERLRADDGD